MSTALPSSITYEMLSRLPPNSFVFQWKEYRPDTEPTDGNFLGRNSRIKSRMYLRGAPNEFLLNTNVFLAGSASGLRLNHSGGGVATVNSYSIPALIEGMASLNSNVGWNAPYHYFDGSRESFNSGSLPYLDNQDTNMSHEINNLRFSLAERNRLDKGSDLLDLNLGTKGKGDALAYTSMTSDAFGASGNNGLSIAFLSNGSNDVDANRRVALAGGRPKNFAIPLGLYSNFVNSHSVIPVGLCSSYSVNGWGIELDSALQAEATRQGRYYHLNADGSVYFSNSANQYNAVVAGAQIRDLRIYAQIIKILDENVMEAVLSLYQKREQVAIGGIQFPLSLKINSLAQRYSRFPINPNVSDYHFRIPGTDRSVRALYWWMYNDGQNALGQKGFAGNSNGIVANATIRSAPIVTRLETRIGLEEMHPCIEDQDPLTTSNILNFINNNLQKSGSLYSPLPYYQEGRRHAGQQADGNSQFNMALAMGQRSQLAPTAFANAVSYGCVSFENLDRREGDYSGSFQASGKDLTNVGSIEVRMRVQQVQSVGANNFADEAAVIAAAAGLTTTVVAPQAAANIVFVYVYDSIMEINASGVMDVTNASL